MYICILVDFMILHDTGYCTVDNKILGQLLLLDCEVKKSKGCRGFNIYYETSLQQSKIINCLVRKGMKI